MQSDEALLHVAWFLADGLSLHGMKDLARHVWTHYPDTTVEDLQTSIQAAIIDKAVEQGTAKNDGTGRINLSGVIIDYFHDDEAQMHWHQA